MNVEKAISFVEESGTELEKYRLDYLLGKDHPVVKRCLDRVIELQRQDGA